MNKPAQINFSYGSAEKLSADSRRILAAFLAGGPVWIGRNGYGSTSYALLNAGERWNPVSKTYYTSRFEAESLPSAWIKAISKIIGAHLPVEV